MTACPICGKTMLHYENPKRLLCPAKPRVHQTIIAEEAKKEARAANAKKAREALKGRKNG